MRPKQQDENMKEAEAAMRVTTRCQLRLRLDGTLIGVARAMRVLKRYRISQSRVSIVREGALDVATVSGILADSRRSARLAAALSRIPGVVEAVVSRDDVDLAAFRRPPAAIAAALQ
jgi:hypothetical protein